MKQDNNSKLIKMLILKIKSSYMAYGLFKPHLI